MTQTLQRLSSTLSFSGQILFADLPDIHLLGFRSILCTRPGREGGAEQPTHFKGHIK